MTGLVLFWEYLYISIFFTFSTLDKKDTQKVPESVSSPTGEYTAHAYYEPYGGAGQVVVFMYG